MSDKIQNPVTVVKKVLLTILFLISFSLPALADEEILVVQSIKIPPYEEALNGFLSLPNPGIKRLVLSKLQTPDLIQHIKKAKPPLILAIGRDALLNLKEIKDIPIVYIMVLTPQSILTHNENFYGISMNILPEEQLKIFTKAIPGLNNIGMVYDPDNTGEVANKAIEAAGKRNIRLIARKASKAYDVPRIIRKMTDEIEAFWMLPDITIMTSETIEFLLIISMEKRIPILTFSDKYTEMGALMSIAVDPYDMGKQAGEIAQKILAGNAKGEENRIFARKAVIALNRKIAEKLGIDLNQELNTDIRFIK